MTWYNRYKNIQAAASDLPLFQELLAQPEQIRTEKLWQRAIEKTLNPNFSYPQPTQDNRPAFAQYMNVLREFNRFQQKASQPPQQVPTYQSPVPLPKTEPTPAASPQSGPPPINRTNPNASRWQPRITPDMKDSIISYIKTFPGAQHEAIDALAQQIGVGRTTIFNWLTIWGYYTPAWLRNMDPAVVQQIENDFRAGKTNYEVAAQYGLAERNTQLIKDRAGIKSTKTISDFSREHRERSLRETLTPEVASAVMKMRSEGMNVRDIATTVGLPIAVLERAFGEVDRRDKLPPPPTQMETSPTY